MPLKSKIYSYSRLHVHLQQTTGLRTVGMVFYFVFLFLRISSILSILSILSIILYISIIWYPVFLFNPCFKISLLNLNT